MLPETQIVVLTMQENPAFAQAALRAGALGYVLKDAADTELMTAVVLAAEGRTYLNPELGARLAARPADSESRPDNLSPREVEVLKLIALGHTNGEIASSLFLSVRTGRVPSRSHPAEGGPHHPRRTGRLRARSRTAGLTEPVKGA